MVKVCDALMGSYKTSSAIRYMNEHKDMKFIFITPYLQESERIKKGCPELHFVEPSNKIKEYNFRKSDHTAALIKEGKNISTTHQAFKGYTDEMLMDIKEKEYTLIVDENVDVLETFEFSTDDLQMAVDTGYVTYDGEIYRATEQKYKGKALKDLFNLLESRELIKVEDKDNNSLFYWALPPELITSFKDVFILTYLFSGQSIHHFLEIYNIEYELIGTKLNDDGSCEFGEYPGYVPEYASHIKDKLHILEGRLNDVGDDYYSLSMSWYKKGNDNISQLKKNVYNFFNNINSDIPVNKKMWGVYNNEYDKIKGKGYTKSFLTFNAKATNNYKDRKCLVYITNIFMNVNEKRFYQIHDIDVDEEIYALSIMIQWIWRSAIREGEDVYLYIPSKRMRELLMSWMDSMSKKGVDNNE